MAAIGIVNTGATLEGYTLVAGAIEVGGRIEVVNLLGLDACNGVVIHLREHIGILLATTNACRGNEMGVDGKALSEEHLIAGANNTTVVEVDIVYKQPCADAVIGKGATLLCKLHDILIEEQTHLILGIGCQVMGRGIEQMAE